MAKKNAKQDVEMPHPEQEQEFMKDDRIYLRDTLIQMDEFKKYGLNQYFLRAILTENYYTLDKAHKLVQDFLNNH